ncbi:tyrosine-type recombinase/integrase [Actinoplanes sp. TBRC 11911]|uniref:tyrosine-type recombinase/integrase n=1 Tax=Actinoplanes sp. TBRC 11911 TaxID=2729386 RepID=UPI00145F97A0|nr:tyrosine-type recombinase/integrase [Actinoplanes sp. TBRC 11911]NMO56056.1 tyrosine-type recombinase/integrase [Actinoplanes sp. TBRC 11911]
MVKPSYVFLTTYNPNSLFREMRTEVSAELFARIEGLAQGRGVTEQQARRAFNVLTMMVIHLGVELSDLTIADMLHFQEAAKRRSRDRTVDGCHAAWQMLVDIGVFPSGTTLRAEMLPGQLTSAQLVDQYQIENERVRALLIRYLDERRPGLDYTTFSGMARMLVGQFWADIEQHHPELATTNLPSDVAQAWKDRVRAPVPGRETRRRWDVFMIVRAFYLDIAEWALADPSWVEWVFPSPVRRIDIEGSTRRGKATAATHQRIRERLPHLQRLVDAAEQWKRDRAALLEAACRTAIGATFRCAEVSYQRISRDISRVHGRRRSHLFVEDLTTAELINLTVAEDEAFWAWAVIETLRHTGIRIEEMLELTQLAIVSHRLADTGEVIPLLQIVPSKSNEERLLFVTPELASVLAAIIGRIRDSDGAVPLVARFDGYERVTRPELPHLFQHRDGFRHRNGWRSDVLHPELVRHLLINTLGRSGITDTAGQPLHYTPHDFRRMFATEAVTGGLPIHIAAKLLGHADVGTTQVYTAVYQDDLIRSYRAFVDRRRAMRPTHEYREPSEAEWTEFQQHFHLRKIELGTCGRPYGTPCAHEHACVRCPMLRVDPSQRRRLTEIIRNLTERISEAKANGWHGEVEGLTVSLAAAEHKLTGLDRTIRNRPGSTPIGMPGLRVDPGQLR